MKSPSKLDDRRARRGLLQALFLVSFFALPTFASEEELVEVRQFSAAQAELPYKQRAGFHGFLIGFSMENYAPLKYQSILDGKTYETMFGTKPLALMGLDGTYKLNFSFASLGLGVGYSLGQIEASGSGEKRVFSMDKLSVKGSLILDRLFDEPYVAPYFSYSVWEFGIEEKAPDALLEAKGKSKMGTALTAGLLFQLNWIEPSTARWAFLHTGLENTYLDLFFTSYSKAGSSADDPDTSTQFDWGAGLKVEF